VSVTINGAVRPRQPSARGTAAGALVNVAGWFTIAVGLYAGVSGAVPLWFGAVVAVIAVPAAGWDQRSTRISTTTTSTTNSTRTMGTVYPP
jgi:hypothetical protein